MRRSRLQVIYDVLKAIQEKDGKIRVTHILYKSNLSHQMLDDYLKELISKKFIKEINEKGIKTYSLEQKGFDFLQRYTQITDFLDLFGLN